MKRVYVYVTEEMFEGLHGMYSETILEVDDNITKEELRVLIEEYAEPEIEYLIDWGDSLADGDDDEIEKTGGYVAMWVNPSLTEEQIEDGMRTSPQWFMKHCCTGEVEL